MAEMLQSLRLGSDEYACSLALESDECETPCDACSEQGKVSNARKYCRECSEWLCSDCSAMHKSQKITKSHNLIDINKLPKETRLDNQTCEPCSNLDKMINAVMFCEECDERLCKDCTTVHTSRKMTKSHNLIPINKVKSSSTVSCEPCLLNGITIQSTKFCNICEETLCDKCTTAHRSQKATKNHELVGVSDYTRDPKVGKIRCEPCEVNGSDKAASEVCMQCEEYLSFSCVKMHKSQKATKWHTIISTSDVPSTWCEPCFGNDKRVAAKAKCGECDEALCDVCITQHKSQKATKGHHLQDLKMSISDFTTCELCARDDKDILATLYCSECEEFYCENCSKMHVIQKATREHKLSDAIQAKAKKEDASKPSRQKSTLDSVTKTNNLETTVLQLDKHSAVLSLAPVPGKPVVSDVKTDSLTIQWTPPANFQESNKYQIRYKERGKHRWNFYHENPDRANVTIANLQAETTYTFQVRAVTDDVEGPYSPESDEISTKTSMASHLLTFTTKVKDGQPSIYQLHSTENIGARNKRAKTRKLELGFPPTLSQQEKTILLVGAVGSGKSTLVDGLINYVSGVNWKDPYRFTLVDLEKEEKNKNQANSQTEWITCYTIYPEEGSRLNYQLNIIDTPGFGDTRGLARDHEIVKQLQELFSAKGQKGVLYIDAVCFLTKAPDARLTAVQKYIFMSILSLFGQTIENNIFALITFADGKEPPVLAAMKEAEVPFVKSYVFNNSGLFASNDENKQGLAPMCWAMGTRSFEDFFDSLETMETKSLQQTQQVLEDREMLEITIQNLQPEVDAGLNKVHQLMQELAILKKYERDIIDNKDFEYECEETRQVKTELPKGQHVTNCLNCNITCHLKCIYANNEDKQKCSVMNNGNCSRCDDKCHWTQHANTPYIFTFETFKTKHTYAEKMKNYKKAGERKISHEEVVNRMRTEIDALCETIQGMMEHVNECNNTLKQIALRPNPLTMVEHIDIMIESEKLEKKDGFQSRINVLQQYRRKADYRKDISMLKEEYKTTRSSTGNEESATQNQIVGSVEKQSKRGTRKQFKGFFTSDNL